MARSLFLSHYLVQLLVLSFSAALPSQTVLNATEILVESGFVSMALTLQLVADSIITSSPTATVFSPPVSSFATGQPSLSLIQFHLSPLAFSVQSLRALPNGAKIPTMSIGRPLTVTTNTPGGQISLNNVNVNESTIYDDGALIVFGIESFFDPAYNASTTTQNPSANSCKATDNSVDAAVHSFHDAYTLLGSRNYSVMAEFLDMQLPVFNEDSKLTVLAPPDDEMIDNVSNFSQYSSLFRRHVLPCRLMLIDLLNLANGTKLSTYLEGYAVNLTKTGAILSFNEVPIAFPDMYSNDWLVVHGLQESLSVQDNQIKTVETPLSYDANKSEETQSDPGEF